MIKVYVFGDTNVGKSSLISCFVNGRFDPYNKSAIGVDFQSVFINFGEDRILTQFSEKIIDYFHCIIAVYDVTDKESYTSVCSLLEKMEKKRDCGNVQPVMIIGNKADLMNKRCVTRFEAEVLALRYQAMHLEISCYDINKVRQELGGFLIALHKTTLDNVQLDNFLHV